MLGLHMARAPLHERGPRRLGCVPSPWGTARSLRSGASPSTFAPGLAGKARSEAKKAHWAAKARRPHQRLPQAAATEGREGAGWERLALRQEANEGGSRMTFTEPSLSTRSQDFWVTVVVTER